LLLRFVHTKEKRGASLLPGPRYKGLRIALSVEPSNAESPTNDAYINPIHYYIGIYTSRWAFFVALF